MASNSIRTTTNKAKAAGVSASSFLDLKAELATKEDEFRKGKAAGKAAVERFEKSGKKPTVWSRTNKGVNARAARDIELEAISKPTLESARAILERKSQIYEKLRKGQTAGLSEKQYETLLVDFDSKMDGDDSSDDEDVDESLTVPNRPNIEDDPVIEYQDEFGRLRTAPRSEVPRNLLPPDPDDDPIIDYEDEFGRVRSAPRSTIPQHLLPKDIDDDDPSIIYNPVDHYPVYVPSADRTAEIEKEYSEDNNPLNLHYDASKEVRAKGAGFYQFSGDDVTRQQQMEELRLAREETEKSRQDIGAVNVKPGDIEGMQAKGSKSRALEKRKRELEERRKLLDAKRRKTRGDDNSKGESNQAPPSAAERDASTHTTSIQPSHSLPDNRAVASETQPPGIVTVQDLADDFLAGLERDMLNQKSS